MDTPNFQGKTLEDAEATADDYGLVVRVSQVETDGFEPGTVISQDPLPVRPSRSVRTIDLSVAAAMPTTAGP